ncbi:hypothetical protein STEG23_007035 [Scotinomys teguina]
MSESDSKEKGNLKEERPKNSKASSKLHTKIEKEKETDQGKTKQKPLGLYPVLDEFKQKPSGLYPVLDEFKQKPSGLYLVLDEFIDITLSDSAEDELDSEEEEDLEEAAAAYKWERYSPENTEPQPYYPPKAKLKGISSASVASNAHFIKPRVWGQLATAFPVFEDPTTHNRFHEAVSPVRGPLVPDLGGTSTCRIWRFGPSQGKAVRVNQHSGDTGPVSLLSGNRGLPSRKPQRLRMYRSAINRNREVALVPTRREYPQVRIIHYMDDILLAAPSQVMLDKAYAHTVQALEKKGLYIAPEKVQKDLIDNHYPKDNLLLFIIHHPVIFPKVTAMEPLKGAIEIYTDGSKSSVGAYMLQGQDPVQFQFQPNTPQIVECQIVYEVFKRFHKLFNLFSNLHYVVNAVRGLETSDFIKESNPVHDILWDICVLIRDRTAPFFIGHIRAHTLLPGPMTAANDLADKATRAFAAVELDSKSMAKQFHQLYHVPAHTLCLKFKISRQLAQDIVKACPSCMQFLHPPHVGINPRGLHPGDLWQMDVTHISILPKVSICSVSTCK